MATKIILNTMNHSRCKVLLSLNCENKQWNSAIYRNVWKNKSLGLTVISLSYQVGNCEGILSENIWCGWRLTDLGELYSSIIHINTIILKFCLYVYLSRVYAITTQSYEILNVERLTWRGSFYLYGRFHLSKFDGNCSFHSNSLGIYGSPFSDFINIFIVFCFIRDLQFAITLER